MLSLVMFRNKFKDDARLLPPGVLNSILGHFFSPPKMLQAQESFVWFSKAVATFTLPQLDLI